MVGMEAADMAVADKEVVDIVAVDKVLESNQELVAPDNHQGVDNQGVDRTLDLEDMALVNQRSKTQLAQGTVLPVVVVHKMAEEQDFVERRVVEEAEEEEEHIHHTAQWVVDPVEDSLIRKEGAAAVA
jgi:hypothetical protein